MLNLKRIFFLSLILVSCAPKRYPPEFLPFAPGAHKNPYGAWIECRIEKNKILEGEFIAIHEDTIFIADKSTLYAVPIKDINGGHICAYNSDEALFVPFVVLGAVSTLTHGFWAIFTLPSWVIAGLISIIIRYYEPIIFYSEHSLKKLSKYARYPQGLPKNIDRKKIKMKGF